MEVTSQWFVWSNQTFQLLTAAFSSGLVVRAQHHSLLSVFYGLLCSGQHRLRREVDEERAVLEELVTQSTASAGSGEWWQRLLWTSSASDDKHARCHYNPKHTSLSHHT